MSDQTVSNDIFRFAWPDEKLTSDTLSLVEFLRPEMDPGDPRDFNFTLDEIVKRLPEDDRREFRSYALRLFGKISDDHVIDTYPERRVFEKVTSEAAIRIVERFAGNSSEGSAWVELEKTTFSAIWTALYLTTRWSEPETSERVMKALAAIDPAPLKDLDLLSPLLGFKYTEKDYFGKTSERTHIFDLITLLLSLKGTNAVAKEHLELTTVDIFDNFPESVDAHFFGSSFSAATRRKGHLRDYFYDPQSFEALEHLFKKFPETGIGLIEAAAGRGHPVALDIIEEIMGGGSLFNRVIFKDEVGHVRDDDENLSPKELLNEYGFVSYGGHLDLRYFIIDLITKRKLSSRVLPQFKNDFEKSRDRMTRAFFEKTLQSADFETGVFLYNLLRAEPERLIALIKYAADNEFIPLPSIARLERALKKDPLTETERKNSERELKRLKKDARINFLRSLDFRALTEAMIANRYVLEEDVRVLMQLAKFGFTQATERMKDVANSGKPVATDAAKILEDYFNEDHFLLLAERPEELKGRPADLPYAERADLEKIREEVVRYFDTGLDVDSWMKLIKDSNVADEEQNLIYRVHNPSTNAIYQIRSVLLSRLTSFSADTDPPLRNTYEVLRRSATVEDNEVAKIAIGGLAGLYLNSVPYRRMSPDPLRTISGIVKDDIAISGYAWSVMNGILDEVAKNSDRGGVSIDGKKTAPLFPDVISEVIDIAEYPNEYSVDAFQTIVMYARGEAAISAEDLFYLQNRIPSLRIDNLVETLLLDPQSRVVLKELALLGHQGAFDAILDEFRNGNSEILTMLSEILANDDTLHVDRMHTRIIETAIGMALSNTEPQISLGEKLLQSAVGFDRSGAWMGLYEVAKEYIGTPSSNIDTLLGGRESVRNAAEQESARSEFDRELASYIDSFIPYITDGEMIDPVTRSHVSAVAMHGQFRSAHKLEEFDRLYREHIESQSAAGEMDGDERKAALEKIPDQQEAPATASGSGVIHIARAGSAGGTPEGIIVKSGGGSSGGLTVNGGKGSGKASSGASTSVTTDDVKNTISDFSIDTSSTSTLERLEELIGLATSESDDPVAEFAKEELQELISQHHEFALIGNMNSLHLIYTIVVMSDCIFKPAKESLVDVAHYAWSSEVLFQARQYIHDLEMVYPDVEFH